jgi:hypothetical protein
MGFELTDGRAIVLLELLRLSLIAQTGLGCVLCIIGIRTAWQDLKWSQAGNGGKQIASAMRLQVEVLLLLVFALTLTLSLFFTVPLDKMMAASVLLAPVAKARTIFNAHMFLLLLVKVVMYRGRRKLDRYYDDQASEQVLLDRGLHLHRRTTDRSDD